MTSRLEWGEENLLLVSLSFFGKIGELGALAPPTSLPPPMAPPSLWQCQFPFLVLKVVVVVGSCHDIENKATKQDKRSLVKGGDLGFS